MVDALTEYLRPKQLSSLLGLKPRQTARVIAEVEALGYDCPPDGHGARRLHPVIAAAVKSAREQQRDLLSLRLNPALNIYLRKGNAPEPETLDVLIAASAELGIVREVAGVLTEAARAALGPQWRQPLWSALGLPSPRLDL